MYEGIQTRIRGLRAAGDIPARIRTIYYYHTTLTDLQATYLNFPGNPSPTDEEIAIYSYMNGLYGSTPVTTDIFDMIDNTAGIADWPTDHIDLLATPDEP